MTGLVEQFQEKHWSLVKNSNDENIDPFSLIEKLVHRHADFDADASIVKNFFHGQIGKFLICGANHGLDQSYSLLQAGWTGFYVEPDPFACSILIENTKNFRNQVQICTSVIWPTKAIIKLNLSIGESYTSSCLDDWAVRHVKIDTKTDIVPVWSSTVTLDEIFQWAGYDVKYVQTDLEGIDIQVIESFDWGLLEACQMICTEAGPAVLKQLCQQGDFMLTDLTQTNVFYKKKTLFE